MKYTVAQLIQRLQDFPDHFIVFVDPICSDITDNVEVSYEVDSDGAGCIAIQGFTPFQPATQQE